MNAINKGSDKASVQQQSPMFATISFDEDENHNINKYSIKLTRVRNIGVDTETGNPKNWLFNQQSFGTGKTRLEYITLSNTIDDSYNYGKWSNQEANLYTDNDL